MSLITSRQQQLKDLVISNFIDSYDKVALQYQNIRQDVFELTNSIHKEFLTNSEISIESRIKLSKLRTEYEKCRIVYINHLHNIRNSILARKESSISYEASLDEPYNSLKEEIERLKSNINDLEKNKRPLVEDMRELLKDFDLSLTKRASKRDRGALIANLKKDEGIRLKINKKALIYSLEDLNALLESVMPQEENTGDIPMDGSIRDATQSNIDSERYLINYLGSDKSFHPFEEEKWIYDIHRSTYISSISSIEDYDSTISNLAHNIRDLVKRGVESHERWNYNAQKVLAIQAALEQFEDAESKIE